MKTIIPIGLIVGMEIIAGSIPAQTVANSALVNLMANPGAEEVVAVTNAVWAPTGRIPRGWGAYSGGSGYAWGATTNEAYGGKYSAFITHTKYGVLLDNVPFVNLALMLGQSDGYSGAKAIPAKPNTTYAFSFWMKGDMPYVYLFLDEWTAVEATPKNRLCNNLLHVQKNGVSLKRTSARPIQMLIPEAGWTCYSGTFTTSTNAKTMALGIGCAFQGETIPGILATGQTIYVDDAAIILAP